MAKTVKESEITKLEQNDKFCPFATGYYGVGTYWFYHNCLGSNCAVWNKEREQCGLISSGWHQ